MKMLRSCAKQRQHNNKYFSFFSKVFAKAGTFFLCMPMVYWSEARSILKRNLLKFIKTSFSLES